MKKDFPKVDNCRTPNAGNANNVRIENTPNGGALNNNNANNTNSVLPDCKASGISKDITCIERNCHPSLEGKTKHLTQASATGDTATSECNYFEKALSYDLLLKALKICCRNVRWKDSTIGYEHNALMNTYKLRKALLNGNYKLYSYQRFKIYEPKEREIVATRLRDRQFQMALCMAGLYDDITEHFIFDNCACQKGKGTDFALKRLKLHLLRFYREHGVDGYVLKCDIHHFFPETLHDVAKAAVRKRVRDPRAVDYVCNVIDSFGGDRGIGLGSQISQLVELAVLDDLDHYVKEKLHIKYYDRYMDDFLLIHENKIYLEYCQHKITEQAAGIGFVLNKKTAISKLSQGVKFLQWRFLFTPTGRLLMLMNKRKPGKQRRKVRKMLRKEATGEFRKGGAKMSTECWIANAKKGNDKGKIFRMCQFFDTERRKYELD